MPAQNNTFSISQLSKVSGVSVRTLHYYDEIGLLVPKRSTKNDYRLYTKRDGVFLQQIIMYRNMGMSLDKIKSILLAEGFDLQKALADQHKLLLSKQAETAKAITQLEVTMSVLSGEQNLSIIFDSLPENKAKHLIDAVKDDALGDIVFEQYGKLSDQDIQEQKTELDEWMEQYLPMTQLPVANEHVQSLVKDSYVMMNTMFYKTMDDFEGVSYQMLVSIIKEGRVDKLTLKIYEAYQTGLAQHYFDALAYFAEHSLQHNEANYMQMR